MLSTPRRSRGISLVEILVTMAVLAFLMLAALPSMSTWLRNSQIRSTAEALQSGLAKARNEAVRRNNSVGFWLVSDTTSAGCTLSSTSASWIVSMQSPAGGCDQAVSETVSPLILEKWARTEASNAVTVAIRAADATTGACTSTASSATSVIFNGFGRVVAGTTPIRCIVIDHSGGSGNRTLNLLIGTGGTIRMCDPAVTDNTDPRKC